jgi:separase
MGHGSGAQYIQESAIYKHKPDLPALLFGCSSAKMCFDGCEPQGIALVYLMSGSPLLLGCLWDVTDRDTDKCTDRIFKAVGEAKQDISVLLEQSKK